MSSPQPPPATAAARDLRWPLALALIFVCAAVFANAAHRGLTYDDKYFTPEEVQWSLRSVAQLFAEDAWAASGAASRLYRPLMWLLLWVEGSLHGPQPLWFHITCIALHMAATLILFFVLLDLLALADADPAGAAGQAMATPSIAHGQVWAAACGALIFAVHPIHTEAVNSIFNRSEILATLGVLAALWLVLRRLRAVGARIESLSSSTWLALSGLYLASLLCRESALSLPALLAVVLIGLRPGLLADRTQRRRLALGALWFLAALAIYLTMRGHALAQRGGLLATRASVLTQSATEPATAGWLLPQRLGPALCMLREGLRLLIYPQPLRASYDSMPGGGATGAAIFHLLVLGSVLFSARGARMLAVAVLFFYVALLPSTRPFSGDPIQSQMGERFLYLPSVSMAIAAAYLAAEARRRLRSYQAFLGLAGLVALVALFATWTVRRNADWASSLSLWQAELRTTPDSVTANRLVAAALIESGQARAAAELCDTRVPKLAGDARLQNHCAIAYDDIGRPDAAEAAYRRAIDLGLGAVAHANLARSLERQGRSAEARGQAELAIESEEDPARRYYRRGQFLLRYHPERRDEAAQEFRRALDLQPRFRAAQNALAALHSSPTP